MPVTTELIPTGPWRPKDEPETRVGQEKAIITSSCTNVVPTVNGGLGSFLAFESVVDGSTASSPNPTDFRSAIAAYWFRDREGISSSVVVTPTKIWRQINRQSDFGTWHDVSRRVGNVSEDADTNNPADILGYTGIVAGAVDFALIGDYLLITTGSSPLQILDISDSLNPKYAINSSLNENFRTVAIFQYHVIAGGSDGSQETTTPNYIFWSHPDDPTEWEVRADSLAGFADLVGSDTTQRIYTSSSSLYVFRTHSIVRMGYVGGDVGFVPQVVDNIGIASPQSIVDVSGSLYYYANDGFRVITTGARSVNIDQGVSQWLREEVSTDALKNIQGYYSRGKGLIYWSFRKRKSANKNTHVLVYRPETKHWGLAEFDHLWMLEYAGLGWTPDSIQRLAPELVPQGLDTPGLPPLDSEFWKSGEVGDAILGTDGRIMTQSNRPLPMKIMTGDILGINGRVRSATKLKHGVRWNPRSTSPVVRLRVGVRETAVDSYNFGESNNLPYELSEDGYFHVYGRGNRIALEFTITGRVDSIPYFILTGKPDAGYI